MFSLLKSNKIIVFMSCFYPIAMVTSMALMEILSVSWAFFALVYVILNRNSIDFKSEFKGFFMSAEFPIVLFIIWSFASTLSQSKLSGNISHHIGPMRIFVLYFAARYTFRTLKEVFLGKRILLYVSSLGLVHAILQHLLEKDIIKTSSTLLMSQFGFGARAQGFFNNSLTYANAFLPILLMGFAFLIFSWTRLFWQDRVLLLIFLPLAFLGIGVSFCRYLFIAMPVCIWILILLRNYKIAIVSLLAAIFLLFSAYLFWTPFQEKVKGSLNLRVTTNFNRIQLYGAYFTLIKDHYFMGVGVNNEKMVDEYLQRQRENAPPTDDIMIRGYQTGHAHNHFVQVFAETGIIGFLLFMWFNITWLVYMIITFRRSQSRLLRGLFAAGISIFFAFHIAGLVQNTFGDSEVLYGMFYFMGTFMMVYKNFHAITDSYPQAS